jgi:protein-tyrosine phosphatase
MRSADWTAIDITADPREATLSGVTMHGGHRFKVPWVTQLKDNLWTGGCANGMVLPDIFDHVVSLYPWEKYAVLHEIKSELSVYMYDSLDQDFDGLDSLANWVNHCVSDGPTLVHCQAGLNRSALVAGRALVLSGMSGADALNLIRKQRSPACLCNSAFEAQLLGYDDN